MGKSPAPKVICLASTKGGVGKTTLAAALAVRAAADKKRVALVDADGQQSLAFWYTLRGAPDNPKWLDTDCTAENIGLIGRDGYEYVLVDTPPALMEQIGEAVHVSDLVLIPVRPSVIDLHAVQATVEICEELKAPFVFVLNHVDSERAANSADDVLSKMGTVLPTRIGYRRAYLNAMGAGKTGPEVERDAKCDEEINALWDAIKRSIAKAARARA